MPYIGNPIYQSAFVTDTFSGNGSTTAFTMSVAPAGTTNVLVAISGVLQDPSTYGVVGTTITFSTAPPTGTGNISCRYLGIPVTGVTTTAYRTVTEFTATANQKTFTPPSYTVGFINVYRNGVLLGSADYTATNGTTVVLTTGATSGDLVTVESFLVSSVLNALPQTGGTVSGNLIVNGASGQTPLQVQNAGTTAMTVDASGNFLAGTTSANVTYQGSSTYPSKAIISGAGTTIDPLCLTGNGSYSYLSFANLNSNNANFRYAMVGGNMVSGTAGSESGNLVFYTSNAGSNAATSERMRILSTGNILSFSGASTTATGTGIAFPATQNPSSDANTLDDYEEGTWTPSPNSGSLSSFAATYAKVGRIVTVRADIALSGTRTSATYELNGLPYAVSSATGWTAGAFYCQIFPAGVAQIASLATTGSTVVRFNKQGSDAIGTDFSNGYMNFSITYLTD